MTFATPKSLMRLVISLTFVAAIGLAAPNASLGDEITDAQTAHKMPLLSPSERPLPQNSGDPFAALLETARQQDVGQGYGQGRPNGQNGPGWEGQQLEQNVCQVAASELVELASPVDGVIEEMHAKRGDAIKKGQLIAELQAESQRAQVRYSRLRAEASSAVNAAKRRVELAERRLERTEALRKAKLMSAEEVDVLISDRDNARLDYETAIENKKIAAAELDVAKAQLENQMIKSPIDGVLITQLLSAGEQVDGKAIALIAKLDPLYVEVSLPLSQLGKFHVGDSAKIYFDGTKLPARIENIALIDQVVEPKSKTFGMRIIMPNPSLTVPAGIGCRIEFLAKKTSQ